MSTRPNPPQKRTSLLPKPKLLTLDPTVLIAQHAHLSGNNPITIGARTVLHPHCRILSGNAAVVVGAGCVIFERARVGMGVGGMGDKQGTDTVLGKNVVVETNGVVEGGEVGDGTVVGVGGVVGRGCVVGRYCTIAASEILPPYTRIPDFTVVYGGGQQRVDRTLEMRPELVESKMGLHEKQLDMFQRLVPNQVAKWM
ncbi:trimeric LpxA-like protein [Decorospora gaudefroyi]|uniref:Dynactin subunit 6 n=1 Tax=Decorospora gaudefroyi TaxID=184978 RepID=A0A6A5K7H0_9PLEO|nr:trimeric LpxA-like protein [Decorospora gaudefroyi]